ncbi:uncharacterized protein B0I36DRAFT_133736 [Microdochium trichocladiopsis]|uniref:Uncharacterized protein n=1 Tax=Microdochium trichocladiopsis TaxID=1682393 RepID=A0A9P8Y586_9PEZI|nr:uncharacterized protein B0I36DRAFT_133736 [Microdochium trichocladiopsis]KAH7029555.1 hypothetical protein B0I36DRAFT_133736 [Microdochium trichocladiopsis]
MKTSFILRAALFFTSAILPKGKRAGEVPLTTVQGLRRQVKTLDIMNRHLRASLHPHCFRMFHGFRQSSRRSGRSGWGCSRRSNREDDVYPWASLGSWSCDTPAALQEKVPNHIISVIPEPDHSSSHSRWQVLLFQCICSSCRARTNFACLTHCPQTLGLAANPKLGSGRDNIISPP